LDIKDLQKAPINIKQPDHISVGVTWVEGGLIMKDCNKPQAKLFYGVCHYSDGVFNVTPLDYKKPLAITTIIVTPPMATYAKPFCEKGHVCLHFSCPINRFDKDLYIREYKDCGAFSLGLPKSLLEKVELWFNSPKMIHEVWSKKCMKPEGGVLYFNRAKFEKEGE